MDIENPFDTKLSANPSMPETLRGALVDHVDTLDFCWAGVRAVFGDLAKPEHALALLPIVMRQADDERQRLRARIAAQTPDAR